MKTGRELFNGFLNNEPLSRPAFIPFIGNLLSRIEDQTMEKLTSDPALWANSLVKATRLFKFDGVVTGFNPYLAAMACGCSLSRQKDHPVLLPLEGALNEDPQNSPVLKLLLDVTQRTFSVCRQNLSCLSALTGPCTLADQLFGSGNVPSQIKKVKPLVAGMTEAVCKTQPDVLILMEADSLPLAQIETSHRRIYNTLKNIASYYNIPIGLYIEDYSPENVTELAKLNMDMIILGPSIHKDLPLSPELWQLGDGTCGLGLGLPLDDIETARAIMSRGLELHHENPGHGLFFTSSGPAEHDIDIDDLHSLVREISNL